MIYIYILQDPLTNEIKYCGKTHNIKERYIGHLKEKKFKNRKYFWLQELKSKNQKPIINIIDEVSDEDWDFWEKYWICQLKTWGFKLLNQTNGGEFSVTGFKHSNEAKRKITNAQKGRKLSEKWKENISEGRKGLKFSEEHLKNLSLSHKGQKPNNNKSVYQINILDGSIINKFDSIKEALIKLNKNLNSYSISGVCKGKLKSSFGYYWCYVDDYENYKFKEYKNINQKRIKQFDKRGNIIKIFESIYEASNQTGFDRGGISHCANDDDGLTYKNYIWLFEGDEYMINNRINKIRENYKVIQMKNEEIINTFDSIKIAENETNIKHIGCVIRGNRSKAGDYLWKKLIL